MKMSHKFVVCFASFLTIGCGGGGSGTSTNVHNEALYPLANILADYVTKSSTNLLKVTGSLTYLDEFYDIKGSARLDESTSNDRFNGVAALKKTQRTVGTITVDGITEPLEDVTNYFFNYNYQPLGYTTSSGYCVSSNARSVPISVTAGFNAEWYTTDCYTNSSRAVRVASSITSYEIIGLTENTADLVITQSIADASGRISVPNKMTYKISTLGTINFKEQSAVINYGGYNLTLTIKSI